MVEASSNNSSSHGLCMYAPPFLAGVVSSVALCAIYAGVCYRRKRLRLRGYQQEWLKIRNTIAKLHKEQQAIPHIREDGYFVARHSFMREWDKLVIMELESTFVQLAGPDCSSWTVADWRNWIDTKGPLHDLDNLINYPYLCMWHHTFVNGRVVHDLVHRLKVGQDIEAEVRSFRKHCDAALAKLSAISSQSARFCEAKISRSLLNMSLRVLRIKRRKLDVLILRTKTDLLMNWFQYFRPTDFVKEIRETTGI